MKKKAKLIIQKNKLSDYFFFATLRNPEKIKTKILFRLDIKYTVDMVRKKRILNLICQVTSFPFALPQGLEPWTP